MYTHDKSAQIVLALLKKFGIRKIVVSPGITNVPIAMSVQSDSFFEVYSVVDERSAAYFATGLAFESGEPVVISCTGATASRNYLPALTEAYYRNLPIIALTSQNFQGDYDNLLPQQTNRTASQHDVKRMSVHLPKIKDKQDEKACIISVNKALIAATKKCGGPVHINLATETLSFGEKALPDVVKTDYYGCDDLLDEARAHSLKEELKGKRVCLLIGSHRKFTDVENGVIGDFINTYDAAVLCDHTSNYHGENKVLISVASDLKRISINPDVVIDIGGVIGDYSVKQLFDNNRFWRVSEDGALRNRHGVLSKLFDCSEYMFFKTLSDKQVKSENTYFEAITKSIGDVIVPELPFSNTFISYQMSAKLPRGSSLHLGINNCLRNMNRFYIDETIDCSCNVGGFGIDGAVSTLIGQSMVNKDRIYFAQIGDLAFFYDMNALGIRNIGKNLRILLVNNGRGMEFRLNPTIEMKFGDKIDDFIAAAGHHGSAKAWSEAMGFSYLSAGTKEEFMSLIDDFCSADLSAFDKPVLFETFVTVEDEQEGVRLLHNKNRPMEATMEETVKKIVKKVMPKKAVDAIKKMKR